MRVTCPACGAELTLDAWLVHEGSRRVVAQVLKLPPTLGARVMRYLGLFRPEKRQLTMDRVESLLDELLPPITTGHIKRNGREWLVPEYEAWKIALDTVLAHRDEGKLRLPLKSHGYLLEVIVGLAAEHEARQEREHHARMARGERPAREGQATTTEGPVRLDAALPKAHLPEHIREQLARLGVRQKKPAEGSQS